ncbi:2,3-bisphosphoglycerate-independent phosphoglycerate mutase [Orchesella cincta]|uniref:2,3-bisphosphoglycerate-independent phosphoglycerate mutase n=1 Tax=Orchesella cincta TaxID=48709 RepID=A0A1D2MJU4_ORCCI|nr:2,3-bisphosphoglycerate-independent phosphoglycerate mutase [Orchesella cincta]
MKVFYLICIIIALASAVSGGISELDEAPASLMKHMCPDGCFPCDNFGCFCPSSRFQIGDPRTRQNWLYDIIPDNTFRGLVYITLLYQKIFRMKFLNFILLTVPLVQLKEVNGEEARFPDFSCHNEYDWDYPRLDGGEQNVQFKMRRCKMLVDDGSQGVTGCYEHCLLNGFGILTNNGSLSEAEIITKRLQILFKRYHKDIAERLAKQILTDCRDIADETSNLLCADRTKLYECVDQAAGCKK